MFLCGNLSEYFKIFVVVGEVIGVDLGEFL